MNRESLVVYDIECYKNYFLISFKKVVGEQILQFDKFEGSLLDIASILNICKRYTLVSFNGNYYDRIILEAALMGFSNSSLYGISSMIIEQNQRPWQVRKQLGIASLDIDHIDLIEVAPLKATLKIYGGRLHCPKLQSLPIDPHDDISKNEIDIIRTYCSNDLAVTQALLLYLEKALELRMQMSNQYRVDLRSKSDAQIAEAVIRHELNKNYGITAKRPSIEIGTKYRYKAPSNLVFRSEVMRETFEMFKTNLFYVEGSGHIELPPVLKNKKIRIGNTLYKIGIGGLHSCEKSIRHAADDDTILRDYDVASYYPSIILNNRLYPKHLGVHFLETYKAIVDTRLKAKKEGNKSVADSLKITINGSFGKFASKWSCLYSPDLMMQVTITGQLSLLMLIERLELAGIPVVSANTDGIVVKTDILNEDTLDSIIEKWQKDTDYVLESTDYLSLNSRDINNYIAVKTDGKVKGKGEFSDDPADTLRKNPDRSICSLAVKDFLSKGIAVSTTIRNCKDITKFLVLRTVNGGAQKDGILLGKAIRWYYGKYELDAIFYATNGNKVAKSDGGVPIMDLPEEFPDDIDYQWYIDKANNILKTVGFRK